MIIQLEPTITSDARDKIIATLGALKFKGTEVKTQRGDYLVCIGKTAIDIRRIGFLPGIADIHKVSDDYKLVSRKWKVRPPKLTWAMVW